MEFCPIKCELNSDNNKFIQGSADSEFLEHKVMIVVEKPDPYDFLAKENKFTFRGVLPTLLSKYLIYNYVVVPIIKCKNLCDKVSPKLLRMCGNNFLWKQVSEIAPEYILLVGAAPLKYFYNSGKVASCRGKLNKIKSPIDEKEYKFLPIYDPKIVHVFPSMQKEIEQDISNLKKYLDKGIVEFYKDYVHILNNQEGENRLLKYRQEALMAGYSSVDIETNTLNMFEDSAEILSIAFSSKEHTSVFIMWETVLQNKYIFKLVSDILINKDIEKWGQGFRFDMKFLLVKYNIKVLNFKSDSLLYHYLLNEKKGTHDLGNLAWEFTEEGGEYKEKTKNSIKDASKLDIPTLMERNVKDTDMVVQIIPVLKEKLKKEGLSYLAEFNVALSKTLMDLEIRGAKIDVELAKSSREHIVKKVQIIESKLVEFANKNGVPNINLGSSKQLSKLIFEKLKIKPLGYTKKSKQKNKIDPVKNKLTPITDKEVIKKLSKKYKWAKYLLMWRAYTKLNSTYFKAFIERTDRENIIRTNFNQDITITGRLSSSGGINLQQLPRADKEESEYEDGDTAEMYKTVKRCVISRFGEEGRIIEFDYSALELRIIATVTKDKNFLEIFRTGVDPHLRTAQLIFKNPNIKKDDKERSWGKTINFGIVYGMSPQKLADKIQVSVDEAERIMSGFFREFSGYKSWEDNLKASIIIKKQAVSLLGRIRRLPDVMSSDNSIREKNLRQGVNAVIQGLASDIVLHSAIEVNYELKKRKMRSMVFITVHDSLVIDAVLSEKDEVIKIAKECMQRKRWDWQIVPLVVDGKIGKNWGEMEKLK